MPVIWLWEMYICSEQRKKKDEYDGFNWRAEMQSIVFAIHSSFHCAIRMHKARTVHWP
jgi:hypothetical protein